MRIACDALTPLSAFNQFVLYVARPDPAKPGKNKKFPVSLDGVKIDCHDPAHWMSLADALAHVAGKPANWGVAFVLTAADPFFFIDIDSALSPADKWSPLAHSLCEAFAGCAVEVSNSGKGLHIIGAGTPPPHSCKNEQFNIEFYTQRRFIALTGLNAHGSAGHAARPECLQWLVEQFFPYKHRRDFEGWTDGPCEEWSGPKEDSELLRRAMASRSAAGAFGAKATFADLWTADIESLSKHFPADAASLYPYNASAVDSALASHLAFWTGRDCERMQRLMLESALVRQKWEDRDDYLERTILAACSVSKDVLTDKEMEPPVLAVAPPVTENVVLAAQQAARLVEGSTFVYPEQQLDLWRGHVYIRDQNAIFVPHAGGEIMSPSAFNVAYGGYTFITAPDNGAKERDAFKAFTQSQAVRQLQAASTCFRPTLPPGALVHEDGRDLVNIYMPLETPRLVGDATLFWTHLEKLLPDERDRTILMSYMAACVQYKGVKFQWAPLVQGTEGNGKSLFTRCVAFAIGRKYTHWPKASKLAAQFNGWMYGKLFYGVEDIYTPRGKAEVIEELKPMITGDQLEIEGKGADQITRDICGNFLFNSNHKDAVRKGNGDRRFSIMYTAQQSPEDLTRDGMDSRYMAHLYRWLKGEGEYAQYGANYGYRIVNELLTTWPIPNEFNPAGECQRAPTTSSTEEVLVHSMGPMESEVMEAIEENRPGFAGGYVSSLWLKILFENARIFVTPLRRRQVLANLGYIEHPGLKGGRVNNAVKPDQGRPVLYVKPHHPSVRNRWTIPEITEGYQAAQAEAALAKNC
jgi:hypothetical protein